MIDVKQAVRIALNYTAEVYSVEKSRHLGLEEVEYDEESGCWEITVGFAREWDEIEDGEMPKSLIPEFRTPPGNPWERTYKSLRIHGETGQVMSIKARVLSA
jgi:hypothetical protein